MLTVFRAGLEDEMERRPETKEPETDKETALAPVLVLVEIKNPRV
jgi:hypothetical protein